MPFRSRKQMKACWASKGFGGKVDCAEWMDKTNIKKIPEKIKENNFPFEESEDGDFLIRKFSENLNSNELHWHRDREDRIIIPIKETNWMFQRDNHLPEPITGQIKIKAGEWHRVIKGNGDLEIKIKKF